MRGVWSPAVEGVRRYRLATWSVLGFHSPSRRDGPCHPSLSPRAVPQCRPGFVLHRRVGAPGRDGGPRQRQDPGPLHSAAQSTEGRPEAAWTRRGRGSQGAASWSEAALRRPAGAAAVTGEVAGGPPSKGSTPEADLGTPSDPWPSGGSRPWGGAWSPLGCAPGCGLVQALGLRGPGFLPRGRGLPPVLSGTTSRSRGALEWRPPSLPPSLGPTCRACAVRRSMRAARAWPAGCTGRPGRLAPSWTRRVSRAGEAAGVGGAPPSRRARPPRLAPAAPQRAGAAHASAPRLRAEPTARFRPRTPRTGL